MNKKINPFIFVALAALLVAGLAVGCMTASVPTAQQRIHYMDADYPTYRTIGEITGGSDLVALGEVVNVLPAVRIIPEGVPLDQLPKEKADAVGYLVTDVTFRIDRVLAGDRSLQGQAVTISQLGGETSSDKYIAEDEPLTQLGEQYALFLHAVDTNHYIATGGGQGRYSVKNGRLQALTSIEEAHAAGVTSVLANMSIDEFAANFEQLAGVEIMPQAAEEVDEALQTSNVPEDTAKLIDTTQNRTYLPLIQAK